MVSVLKHFRPFHHKNRYYISSNKHQTSWLYNSRSNNPHLATRNRTPGFLGKTIMDKVRMPHLHVDHWTSWWIWTRHPWTGNLTLYNCFQTPIFWYKPTWNSLSQLFSESILVFKRSVDGGFVLYFENKFLVFEIDHTSLSKSWGKRHPLSNTTPKTTLTILVPEVDDHGTAIKSTGSQGLASKIQKKLTFCGW